MKRLQSSEFLWSLSAIACLILGCSCAPEGDHIGTSELIIYGTATRQGQGVPSLQVHITYGPPNCPVLGTGAAFSTAVTEALGKYSRRIVTLFTPGTVVCWRAVLLFAHPDNRPDSLVQSNILFPTQTAGAPLDSLRIDFSLP